MNESGYCNGALNIGGRLDYQLIKVVDNYQGNGETYLTFVHSYAAAPLFLFERKSKNSIRFYRGI